MTDPADNIVDLTAAVEARRREEAEQLAASSSEKDDRTGAGGPDDPRFVRQCLDQNERGDGILYATKHRGRFVYVKSRDEKSKSWFRWSGHHWEIDKGDFHHAAVEDIALIYQREAISLKDAIAEAREKADTSSRSAQRLAKQLKQMIRDDAPAEAITEVERLLKDEELVSSTSSAEVKGLIRLQKNYYDRVDRLRSVPGVKKCLDFAHKLGKDGLFIYGDEIDKKPMLLPCTNGVIDLETGELVEGRPDDYLVRGINVIYNGIDDPAPDWERMVAEIHEENPALLNFIHRFFGYCISGKCTEQVYACFIGDGANGKGTMFEMLREIMGDLSWSINPELLLDNKTTRSPDGPSPAIMSLQGRRLVVASETDDGRKISAANIKRFTGNDTLTGRNLFDVYDTNFTPTHKLILYTQHPPRGLASDFALKRRLLYITYRLRYVDDPEYHAKIEPLQADCFRKKDPDLSSRLRQQKSGILAWLVRGCLLWQRDGLMIPDSIRAAVEDIALREDYVQQFVDTVCRQSDDPAEGVTFKALYERYAKWYRDEIGNDEKDKRFLLSKRKFGEKLRAKGYQLPDKTKTSGTQGVVGVTFEGANYDDLFVWRGHNEGGGAS